MKWKISLNSIKLAAPMAALVLATMVAPAAFAAGGNNGGNGGGNGGAGNVQAPPAVVVSTQSCARATLATPNGNIKLGLSTSIPYTVNVQNCSNTAANLDVSITLFGVSASSFGCTAASTVGHALNVLGGHVSTLSLNGALPKCLGQYIAVVLVSKDGKLLQGASNVLGIKLI